MKSIRSFLFGAGFIFALSSFLHAQEAATVSSADATVDSMTDLEVLLKAVQATPSIPAASLPDVGTFWSAQHAPGSAVEWAPMPSNFGLSAWQLDNGSYLLNDFDVDYDAIRAEHE